MTESIKKKTLWGTAIVLGGNALNHVFRLAGNLILTRMLVPEMFGLMAIANVVILGMAFFSDVGLGIFIIRSQKKLEPDFLNTIWTMKIVRGLGLWGVTLIVAKPAAIFYSAPLLCWMLPIIGFAFVLDGFQSLAVPLQKKELQMGRLTIMNLGAKCSGLVCMIILAYFFRSVWALVFGGLIASLINLIWSFFLDRTLHHRLTWNKSVVSVVFHYGKWIFLSTAMTFLATQADRLILGKLFPLALLGIYSVAAGFAEVPKNLVNTVCESIMLPLISMFAHLERPELRRKILAKRKLLLVPMALGAALLTGFGDIVINGLYDSRYVEAGWILPLLAVGMWPLLLHATIDRGLFVVDNPIHPAIGNVSKFFYMIICLPLAFHFTGKLGAVLVIALNDLPVYTVINYGLCKKGLSGLGQDAWATVLFLLFIIFFIYLRHLLGLGFPGYAAFHAAVPGV